MMVSQWESQRGGRTAYKEKRLSSINQTDLRHSLDFGATQFHKDNLYILPKAGSQIKL